MAHTMDLRRKGRMLCAILKAGNVPFLPLTRAKNSYLMSPISPPHLCCTVVQLSVVCTQRSLLQLPSPTVTQLRNTDPSHTHGRGRLSSACLSPCHRFRWVRLLILHDKAHDARSCFKNITPLCILSTEAIKVSRPSYLNAMTVQKRTCQCALCPWSFVSASKACIAFVVCLSADVMSSSL